MSDLALTPTWTPGVRQLERTDQVDAGVGGDGIANQQAKDLGNRTEYLKVSLEDEVGDRSAALAAEQAARIAADNAEATTRANADNAEASARVAGDAAEASARIALGADLAVAPAGHRLSYLSGSPTASGDVSQTLFLTAYEHAGISLFDGTRWVRRVAPEVSFSVAALGTDIYDVFARLVGGDVTLEVSQAWVVGARQDALTRRDGLWVDAANHQRLHVGTIRVQGGYVFDYAMQRRIWNRFNRVARKLYVSTASSWLCTVASWREANGTPHRCDVLFGDGANVVDVEVQAIFSASAAGIVASVGVGLNSTTANSADTFGVTSLANVGSQNTRARLVGEVGVGAHDLVWLERGGNTITFYGDAGSAPEWGKSRMVGTVMA